MEHTHEVPGWPGDDEGVVHTMVVVGGEYALFMQRLLTKEFSCVLRMSTMNAVGVGGLTLCSSAWHAPDAAVKSSGDVWYE